MVFLRYFVFCYFFFYNLAAYAYLAPLLGGAGAIAAFLAFIFAIIASFAFLLWFHFRNFFNKILNKFSKKNLKEKSIKSPIKPK